MKIYILPPPAKVIPKDWQRLTWRNIFDLENRLLAQGNEVLTPEDIGQKLFGNFPIVKNTPPQRRFQSSVAESNDLVIIIADFPYPIEQRQLFQWSPYVIAVSITSYQQNSQTPWITAPLIGVKFEYFRFVDAKNLAKALEAIFQVGNEFRLSLRAPVGYREDQQ